MFKKLNTKTLMVVVALLALAVAVNYLVKGKKGERTFKSEIFEADTAKVTAITIVPRDKAKGDIRLEKNTANNWVVQHQGQSFPGDAGYINNLLSELTKLKVERVAATKKERWEKYEVTDSLATRVKVEAGGKEVANIMIGKFSYQQQQVSPQQMQFGGRPQPKMSTYVRLASDKVVYSVPGFLNMTFNRELSAFRNKTLVPSGKASWTRLTLDAPEGRFIASKMDSTDQWMIDGLLADSAQMADYLNYLSGCTSSEFVDNETLGTPSHTLKIEGVNMPTTVEIKASPKDSTFLVASSTNQGAIFNGGQQLFPKLFRSKEQLLNITAEQ